MYAGIYPASYYQRLVEFGATRRGGSKSIILSDEQVDTLVECLPVKRDSMCGGDRVTRCQSVGNFWLQTTQKRGSARLCLGAEYVSLTQPDMDYLARVFRAVKQLLRYYIIALPDGLSYVTSSLTSVSYVEPAPDASKNLNYLYLYEELVTFL